LFANFNKKTLWQTKTASRSAAPSRNFVGFLLGLTTLNELKRYTQNIYCTESAPTEQVQNPEEVERAEKIALMKKITSYEVGDSTDFREGQIREVKITHEGKEVTVCIIRVEGRLYCTSAYCTYDDKTPLKDGIVFGDKLMVPIYGTAYSIKSGSVEYGPSIDNLAIFFVREKDGKVIVGLPKYPPKKVRPMTTFRDYNDLRKVVIIGSGIAATACIITLRENGFTGEIRMISADTRLPYDKTKLSKSFKNVDYDELYLRSEEFYEEHGIEYLLGREVKGVNNKHGIPHVILEDGLRIEYDALLVASGNRPEHREIEGLTNQANVSFLRNIEDHKNIRANLDHIKNVTIIGANTIGLETAATIRTEYPHINVHVIDENETLALDDKLGKEVTDTILDLHRKNGVKFTFARPITRFHGDEQAIKEIELDGERMIKTDFVIMFPNISSANTDYLFEGENIDNMEFDDEDRLKVNFNQRSGHKRIFGAGDATAGMYFVQSRRMPCDNYYTAYHTGQVAAYNMLALDIPNAVVPFTYTKQYNQYFNYSGYASYFNDVHIDGDLKSMDFIVYYSLMGTVLAAFGSEKRKRDMLVINEAFRLDIMPTMEDIKRGAATVKTLEKNIREAKRSGCFKDLINDIKYSANPDEVVWMQREKSNEYHNFWKEGLQHMGANVTQEEFDN